MFATIRAMDAGDFFWQQLRLLAPLPFDPKKTMDSCYAAVDGMELVYTKDADAAAPYNLVVRDGQDVLIDVSLDASLAFAGAVVSGGSAVDEYGAAEALSMYLSGRRVVWDVVPDPDSFNEDDDDGQ